MGSEEFSKKYRINKTGVDRLFENSKTIKSRLVLLRYRANDLEISRIVPIASKKAGKANIRNEMKRRMRDVFRKNKEAFCPGFDYALIARFGFAKADYEEIKKDILYCAAKCKKEQGVKSNASDNPQNSCITGNNVN